MTTEADDAVMGPWLDIACAPDREWIIGLAVAGKAGMAPAIVGEITNVFGPKTYVVNPWNGMAMCCTHWLPLPKPPVQP